MRKGLSFDAQHSTLRKQMDLRSPVSVPQNGSHSTLTALDRLAINGGRPNAYKDKAIRALSHPVFFPADRNSAVTLQTPSESPCPPTLTTVEDLPWEIMLIIFRMHWSCAWSRKAVFIALSLVSRRWTALIHATARAHVIRFLPEDDVLYDDILRGASDTASDAHFVTARHQLLPADARSLSFMDVSAEAYARDPLSGTYSCHGLKHLLDWVASSPSLGNLLLYNVPLAMPMELRTPASLSAFAAPRVKRLTLSLQASSRPSPWYPALYMKRHPYADGADQEKFSLTTPLRLDILFPELEYLKLERPKALLYLFHYFPRTLRCLVLEAAPSSMFRGRSTLQAWTIAEALDQGLFSLEARETLARPSIIVRGGSEEPVMWSTVLAACIKHDVLLERVVVYERNKYMLPLGLRAC